MWYPFVGLTDGYMWYFGFLCEIQRNVSSIIPMAVNVNTFDAESLDQFVRNLPLKTIQVRYYGCVLIMFYYVGQIFFSFNAEFLLI